MAATRVGRVTRFTRHSDMVATFDLMPEEGHRFPPYQPGQYIALRRNDCELTKKVVDPDGRIGYVPALDEQGNRKIGPVTHSYSIASAPFETEERGCLEFYIVLEGRLTASLFRIRPGEDDQVTYHDRITGDFTLEKRAADCDHVLMVGTGTGVAPFVSIIKQLDHDGPSGKPLKVTLVHANRTTPELNYRQDFERIAQRKRVDFVYVPSVSRPTKADLENPRLGKGRANNVLRHILDMPLREEEALEEARSCGGDAAGAEENLRRAVRPVLPEHLSREGLAERILGSKTVVMTCGNPGLMSDIEAIALRHGFRFEKEEW